jgi:hypothetical protein
MSDSLTLDWSEFKSYIATNYIPFKQLVRNNAYWLYLSDGALTAQCTINKDGGSDQLDYEASYQSKANVTNPYYSLSVAFRQSATTAANSTVLSLRNPIGSTRTLFIELINLNMSFDSAAPITRSTQSYYICGFNTATPTGGTALSVANLDSSNPTSQVTDARFADTGLTTSGVAFGNRIMTISCPATDQTIVNFKREKPFIKLAPGEGLAIKLGSAAVVGQALAGEICWSER